MSSFSSPLFSFAHSGRILILEELYTGSKTVTELSKSLDISNSEISRHLSKLAEYKFISKDKKYYITDFGRSSLELFAPLNFVFKNVDYFNSHSIDGLPQSNKHQLNELVTA